MPAKSEAQRSSYIAGFFDGEGNISILKRNQYLGGNGSYGIILGFTNRDLPVLQWILQYYYGSLFEKKRYSIKHSKSFELRITQKKILKRLLLDIYPFVRIKRKQVELALAFLKLKRIKMEVSQLRGKRWALFTANKEDVKKREVFKENLTLLNQRGVVCLQ